MREEEEEEEGDRRWEWEGKIVFELKKKRGWRQGMEERNMIENLNRGINRSERKK